MIRQSQRKRSYYNILGLVVAGVIFANFTTGCYALRKKFIRKHKRKKEEAPVYVNFRDYPEKPTRDAYLNYYLFVRGWLDDLQRALKKNTSWKRQKKDIAEAIVNFEQIIRFFNEEGKKAVENTYLGLVNIKKKIESDSQMGGVEINHLIKKIEHLKRKFEHLCKYSNASKWMD